MQDRVAGEFSDPACPEGLFIAPGDDRIDPGGPSIRDVTRQEGKASEQERDCAEDPRIGRPDGIKQSGQVPHHSHRTCNSHNHTRQWPTPCFPGPSAEARHGTVHSTPRGPRKFAPAHSLRRGCNRSQRSRTAPCLQTREFVAANRNSSAPRRGWCRRAKWSATQGPSGPDQDRARVSTEPH